MDKLLKSVYYGLSSPASFSGENSVYREAKKRCPGITYENVRNFLKKQRNYQIHKPIKQKFLRNKTIAIGIDSHWQADLCDMKSLEKYNDGYKYLLTCIDVFSRYAWAIPVKNKTPESITAAFQEILKKSKRKPMFLMTDRGREFMGSFKNYTLKKDIHHHFANSPDVKAAVVERYNRTLKTRLWKVFSEKKTFRYLNLLPKVVTSINRSYHRIIGCSPVEVTKKNENEVRIHQYGREAGVSKGTKFRVGEKVRITKEKKIFDKGYLPNFTLEVFVIDKILPRKPIVYKLRDLNGEDVEGIFYDEELVRVVS